MSLSPDDIIQTATGSTTGVTSVSVTLPGATTEGNTVIIGMFTTGTGGATATGFTRDNGVSGSAPRAYILRKADVTGGENSWTVLGLDSTPATWVALELQGLHPHAPVDVTVGGFAAATGVTTATTSTTPRSTAYEGLAIAFFGARNVTNSTVPVLSAPTNGFEIITSSSRTDGATATACAIAVAVMTEAQTWQSTATSSVTANTSASLACYAAAGSKRVPNLDVATGFEFGTTAGLTTGNAGCPPLDTQTGTVQVLSTAPRTGSYHLALSGTGAAANVQWTNTGALGVYTTPTGILDRTYIALRFSVRFPTLPSSDVMVAAVDAGSDASPNGLYLIYRASTGTLGMYLARSVGVVGTEVQCSVAMSAGTWHDIDILGDFANAKRLATFSGLWTVNGVQQTTATVGSSTAASVIAVTAVRFGWQAASTATIWYDDVAVSRHPGHYPMGSVKIYPVGVDTSATPTVTNAASFSTFTNNGTMNTTFSTTTARNAVDEIPPTIGATADGFAQDTIGASDYVELPMATRSAATNLEGIRGMRWYFPGWAQDANAATIGFRSHDGTTETTLFAAADPNFDASTTSPAWVCRMQRTAAANTAYLWSQAKLDAMTARVGFSGDATPNVGVHAVFGELVMAAAYQQQVVEVDGVLCYALIDPDSSHVIAFRLVAPVDSAATATYNISGSNVVRNAAAGGEDLYTVGAESAAVVAFVTAGRA